MALGRAGEPVARIVFYFALGTTVAGLCGMAVTGISPWNWSHAVWLLPIGILASLGQMCLTRAYSRGATLVVANLQYSGIVFAALYGLFLFDEQLPLIGWLGMLLIISNATGWVFGHTTKAFPTPFQSDGLLFGGLVSAHELGSTAVTLAVLILVYLFFAHTSLGLAMRAAAYNPRSARLVGIRVGWMLALGWGLAAAIGSVAGMMVAPAVFLDPNMMLGILLYAFAGALLGGIDNPAGAVGGGFAVGVLENLAGAYVVGTELKLTVALVIIIGVLVVRPSGLFGRVVFSRV
jgi:branched-subunit amino acid ABC-type transport system permease component